MLKARIILVGLLFWGISLLITSSCVASTTVFEDGFATSDGWVALPLSPMTNPNPLTLTPQRNHGDYPGINSMRTSTSGQGCIVVKQFDVPFAEGRFETWFFDGGGLNYQAHFESTTDGWVSYPAAFTNLSIGAGGQSGNCLQADDQGLTCGAHKAITTGFKPGENYQLQMWVRWPAPAAGAAFTHNPKCFVRFNQGASEIQTNYSADIPADGQWRNITLNGVVPSGADSIWIGTLGVLDSIVSYQFFVDTVSLVTLPTTPPNDDSRQGLQVRCAAGDAALKCAYFIGCYSTDGPPGATQSYSVGQYILGGGGSGSWQWQYNVKPRSAGWRKLAIEFLPYTGVNDIRFYIDSVLVATMNRSLESVFPGISIMALGFHQPVNWQGWFDDASLRADIPDTPVMQSALAEGPTAIRWRFWDESNNEAGFRLHSSDNLVVSQIYPQSGSGNLMEHVEESLSPNTAYSRKVSAYNGSLNSGYSSLVTRWTLPQPPTTENVLCNFAAGQYYRQANFQFTAVGGFGVGKVASYRYAWNQSPSYSFTGGEPNWINGILSVNAVSLGNYYLHVRAMNGEGIAGGSLTLGPYGYAPFPLTPSVILDGPYSPPISTIHAKWTQSYSAAPIVRYKYAVGTEEDVPDVVGWTDAGLNLEAIINIPGGLQAGSQYYVFVRAEDSDGLISFSGVSPPLSVIAPSGSIGQARNNPDGTPVALSGVIVSAEVGSGAFYVQDANRSGGIRIEGASPGLWSAIELAGILNTTAGERVVTSPIIKTITPPNPENQPRTMFMATTSVSGESPNPHTPGASNRQGLYNVGLLIRSAGRVLQANSDSLLLDDGSTGGNTAKALRVYSENGVSFAGYAIGDYLGVTGISAVWQSGTNLISSINVLNPSWITKY